MIDPEHGWVPQIGPDRGESKLAEWTLRPYRLRFLIRAGIGEGDTCLVMGPGAVSVALLLGEVVGRAGSVTCFDPCANTVRAARATVESVAHHNVELEVGPASSFAGIDADVVYGVNLFAATTQPDRTAEALGSAVSPESKVILEEVDLRGAGTEPPTPSLRRWLGLRAALMRRTGGDPDGIRRALTVLRRDGFELDDVDVAQPTFAHGSALYVPAAEFESARPALVSVGLLSDREAH